MPSDWNSLEVAKFISSLATPVVVGWLGIHFSRITKQFEHIQWRSQKIIEKRLQIYDDLAPLFNDLLCYFTYIGTWKEVSPEIIIASKRIIDRKVYLAKPLFSHPFFEASQKFMSLCFKTYNGWGEDPKLQTEVEYRQDAHPNWNTDWNRYFHPEAANPNDIHAAYQHLMDEFSKDIGLMETITNPSPARSLSPKTDYPE